MRPRRTKRCLFNVSSRSKKSGREPLFILVLCQELRDPATTHYNISVVEDYRLPGSDRSLRHIEIREDFLAHRFNGRARSLVTMPDLRLYSHRLAKLVYRDPV